MPRADGNFALEELYRILMDHRFDFMPRGEHHIRRIYKAVKERHSELCDDSYLCSTNCKKGTNSLEWQHVVRAVLKNVRDRGGSVAKGNAHGFWLFGDANATTLTLEGTMEGRRLLKSHKVREHKPQMVRPLGSSIVVKENGMSTIITRPAALVTQGKLRLYTTSLRVADLLLKDFYSIERLDPENLTEGYQRLLNKARAKRLADYLIDGHRDQDTFLPTSIFLATDKPIQFDESKNTITFDVSEVGPFSVVDGQHRIEGLKMAAEKAPELLSFEVPVNIAVSLSKLAQMCHFLIVNTTQKSVDKGVEQRIYARLNEAIGYEDVPNLPKWIQRIVETGDDVQALPIVDFLRVCSKRAKLCTIEYGPQTLPF